MHHATIRLELHELALARGEAQDLAAKGRTDLGIKLLEKGLARAVMLRNRGDLDGEALVSAWREALELFAENHGWMLG